MQNASGAAFALGAFDDGDREEESTDTNHIDIGLVSNGKWEIF
jgi:hypothetical protein